MVVTVVVGAGSVMLAIYNASEHRWTSMTANVLIVIGMACSLFAQRQLNKQRDGKSRPS